jgi:peroxiredoxin
MRYYILLALTFFAASSFAQKSVPNIDLKSLDGKTVNIKDYATNGKITVICFWATWCSPCKNELDAIADLYSDWQEKYDVELLAITIDTQRALASKVPGIISKRGWDYKILSDSKQELQKALDFLTVPQTFVLDKEDLSLSESFFLDSNYTPGDEYELEDKIKELSKK